MTPQELAAALNQLSKFDLARLTRSAKHYARYTPFKYEELLDEAILRGLDGRRLCPVGIEIPAFIVQVMRSVRSEWLNAETKSRKTSLLQQILASLGHLVGFVPNPVPTPEEALNRQQDSKQRDDERFAEKVLSSFDGDAKKVVEGMMLDLKGADLFKWTGLTRIRYESARRSVNRKIERVHGNQRGSK